MARYNSDDRLLTGFLRHPKTGKIMSSKEILEREGRERKRAGVAAIKELLGVPKRR